MFGVDRLVWGHTFLAFLPPPPRHGARIWRSTTILPLPPLRLAPLTSDEQGLRPPAGPLTAQEEVFWVHCPSSPLCF